MTDEEINSPAKIIRFEIKKIKIKIKILKLEKNNKNIFS